MKFLKCNVLVLLDVNKKVCLEVNAEKTKVIYTFVSSQG